MSEDEVRHYSLDALPLETDATGARYWGVSLRRTMLTYFEVPVDCRFEEHQHESEQITHVLEGELFFELGGRTIRVGPGEVIAIPSGVRHAVFTRSLAARAVDAWSPVLLDRAAGAKDSPVRRARGTFEVKLSPQPLARPVEGSPLGRMSLEKQFHGPLEAASTGEMLTAMSSVQGSAAYSAIERVTGSLDGRRGSFVLQHTGVMTRGAPG